MPRPPPADDPTYFWAADDRGMADYVIAAFALFGPAVPQPGGVPPAPPAAAVPAPSAPLVDLPGASFEAVGQHAVKTRDIATLLSSFVERCTGARCTGASLCVAGAVVLPWAGALCVVLRFCGAERVCGALLSVVRGVVCRVDGGALSFVRGAVRVVGAERFSLDVGA